MVDRNFQARYEGSIPFTRFREIPAKSGITETSEPQWSASWSARADQIAGSAATGRMLCAAITVLILCLLSTVRDADATPPRRGTPAYCRAHADGVAERTCIVRVMWASRGQSRKAISVASCETGGTFSPRTIGPHDETGQPRRGVWQFGSHERAYFHPYGMTVESQTAAAIRYYDYNVEHGAWGWTSWECA